MKTCAFSGHRPQNLPWQFNETDINCLKLKEILTLQIAKLANNGYPNFLSGLGLGVDTWAAETVLNLRNENSALKLYCILPCKNQAAKWPAAAQQRYERILSQADGTFYASRDYHPNCMLARNRFMVEKADLLLAVYDEKQARSGTGATLRYAQKLVLQIITIDPISLQMKGAKPNG